MRNSSLVKPATDYLFKSISSPDFYLTTLSLKFTYPNFEQLLELASALRFNKTLVRLDLSSNALRPQACRFLLDALLDNVSLVDLNLSSNFLDDEFAGDLAIVLGQNPVLWRVDIGRNPIGAGGAKRILECLLQENETIGDLGMLEQNVYMGVRIREEIR